MLVLSMENIILTTPVLQYCTEKAHEKDAEFKLHKQVQKGQNLRGFSKGPMVVTVWCRASCLLRSLWTLRSGCPWPVCCICPGDTLNGRWPECYHHWVTDFKWLTRTNICSMGHEVVVELCMYSVQEWPGWHQGVLAMGKPDSELWCCVQDQQHLFVLFEVVVIAVSKNELLSSKSCFGHNHVIMWWICNFKLQVLLSWHSIIWDFWCSIPPQCCHCSLSSLEFRLINIFAVLLWSASI